MDEKREESVGPGDLSDHVLERQSMYNIIHTHTFDRVGPDCEVSVTPEVDH